MVLFSVNPSFSYCLSLIVWQQDWTPHLMLIGILKHGWINYLKAWKLRWRSYRSVLPVHSNFTQAVTFTTVDRLISLFVSLSRNQFLDPNLVINERAIMFKMVDKLLKYLHSNLTVYHVRAVNLIWSLQASTTRTYVESIIAQSITSAESPKVSEAYEAFGVLWRLSGELNLFRRMSFLMSSGKRITNSLDFTLRSP